MRIHLPESSEHACKGALGMVTKWREVTQSFSLVSIAHSNTQRLETHVMTNMLLVEARISCWLQYHYGHATTESRVGCNRMSSKVIQHAGKLRLPQHSCEEFHQTPETCVREKPSVSGSISAVKKGHEPFFSWILLSNKQGSNIYFNRSGLKGKLYLIISRV